MVVVVLLVCAAAATGPSGGVRDSSNSIADKIVRSQIPVVVDFWAAWCAPCRILDPVIEDLEKEYRNRVLFIKVDVDIHKNLAGYFKVSSIPSIFIIKDKTVVASLPGVQDKETYRRALDAVLNPPGGDGT